MTAPRIRHDRDLIVDGGGQIEQEYNFLDYDFTPMGLPTWGRMYLFEPYAFAFRSSVRWAEVPEEIRAYLTHRFGEVRALGSDGYATIWQAEALT